MIKIITSLGGTGSLTRFSKAKNYVLGNTTEEPYFIVVDSKQEQNNMQNEKTTYSESNKKE